jgi:3',5'-cyclic AMP phosphodiesterase CpdA
LKKLFMNEPKAEMDSLSSLRGRRKWLLDPRHGDLEDDHAATSRRSLLSIAGSLLVEISLSKLLVACTISILLPAVLLGLAPLLLSAWLVKIKSHLMEATGLGLLLVIIIFLGISWLGGRVLFRIAEQSFWSLNALAVQPGYAFWREAMRHLVERALKSTTGAELAGVRAASCLLAGLALVAFAAMMALSIWPFTQWIGAVREMMQPWSLVVPTVANAVFIMSSYLGAASLFWSLADAVGGQPLDIEAFDTPAPETRTWRIAHLSDVHVVGERYGFRIESGRSGPRGNGRLVRAMKQLSALHAENPLDCVLVTGDMTDAGTSAEWSEFLEIMAGFPDLAGRMLILPGNHDVNIIDRGNPARLNFPFSPARTLRKMRTISVMDALHGDRVRLVTTPRPEEEPTLAGFLDPYRHVVEEFADKGGLRRSLLLSGVWDRVFPLILPPSEERGVGVALLDSNADANFSFTNALGMISAGQARRLTAAFDAYPGACWVLAMHHHLVEYPRPASSLSDRVATALINGTWFLHVLRPYAHRLVVMHGHRHVDWIGTCGELKIVSAPSPVMGRADGPAHFYVHVVAAGQDGGIRLLSPHMIEVDAGLA